MGRATDRAGGHRRRSVRAMWRGKHRCDIPSTDDRRRPPRIPRYGACTPHRDTLWRSRARRSVHGCTRRVRSRGPQHGAASRVTQRSPREVVHRQVALPGGAAQCTAADAPVNRSPTLFPYRRLTRLGGSAASFHPALAKRPRPRVRPQHLIRRWIVDFYCFATRLVIEVDGDVHDMQRAEYGR